MSKIEWTEQTWNPIVGCSIVSPGCTNCYAMGTAARNARMNPGLAHYQGLTKETKAGHVWTGKLALAEHKLLEPLQRRKPTTYFVNSMSDLFHESVPDDWIDRVFAVMALCPQHTFQVLTKRSARMREVITRLVGLAQAAKLGGTVIADEFPHVTGSICHPDGIQNWPLPNVWLGVSAERQKEADERIPDLLATPAAVRFVSAEPLLGPIDFERLPHAKECDCAQDKPNYDALGGSVYCAGCCEGPERMSSRLDWVIVGGESGKNARPMHPDWVRSIRDQCAAAGTAFFFKQWGEWAPGVCGSHPQTKTERVAVLCDVTGWRFDEVTVSAGAEMHRDDEPDLWRFGKTRAGRHLDGVIHDATPNTAQRTEAA